MKGFQFDEKSYTFISKTLQDRFDDDDDLVAFHLGAIEDLSRVREKDTSGLWKFFSTTYKLMFKYLKQKDLGLHAICLTQED